MMGLPLNRGIRSDEGQLQDIIAGDFFICYAPIESERFLSMPPELEEKYKEKFDLPEMFMMENGVSGSVLSLCICSWNWRLVFDEKELQTRRGARLC